MPIVSELLYIIYLLSEHENQMNVYQPYTYAPNNLNFLLMREN